MEMMRLMPVLALFYPAVTWHLVGDNCSFRCRNAFSILAGLKCCCFKLSFVVAMGFGDGYRCLLLHECGVDISA